MGEVWAARNEATGAEVALKMLASASADEARDGRARLRREAHLGAMLSHRSIVRTYDLVETPDAAFVLKSSSCSPGETLAERLRTTGPLAAREAVATLLPILAALDHAHASGVVHRDVKPSNIFLAVEPDALITPKLLDFGIAKVPPGGLDGGVLACAPAIDGRALGTPAYMSPEQIRATTKLDGRSDLFAVGAVLYELVTGASPFGMPGSAPTPGGRARARLRRPTRGSGAALQIEVTRALAKRPEERHATASSMARALREAVGGTVAELASLLFARSSPASRARRSARTRPPAAGSVPSSAPPSTASVETAPVPPRRSARQVVVACAFAGIAIAVGLVVFRLSAGPAPEARHRVDTVGAVPLTSAAPLPPLDAPPVVDAAAPGASAAAPHTSEPPRP